jgi:starch synthase
LKILFLAAEAEPFVKVGGLADVAGALPRELVALGHDVRLALPGYGTIDRSRLGFRNRARFGLLSMGTEVPAHVWEAEVGGVSTWLVAGPPLPDDRRIYAGSVEEDTSKFVFFSLAALAACREVEWKPDVVHANDWHTGAAVYDLSPGGAASEFLRETATLFTIHNLPYIGRNAGPALAQWGLRRSEALRMLPEWAQDSLLAIGLATADVLTTVSPTYAREIRTPEAGHGLDGVLRVRSDRLHGILNGIDVAAWNPASDPALRERYDVETLEKRRANRLALQEEAGLETDERALLLAMVSRLDSQKGFDIAVPVLTGWLDSGGQLVVLGTGDPSIEHALASLEDRWSGRASVRLRFDGPYSSRIYGGADAILIPSKYEPCGLTQMIAMRYGAVPIARRTGGLADTITDVGDPAGTGVLFDGYDTGSLAHALERAVRVYAEPDRWRELQRRGMTKDFSWKRPALEYEALYGEALRYRREATRAGEED